MDLDCTAGVSGGMGGRGDGATCGEAVARIVDATGDGRCIGACGIAGDCDGRGAGDCE